MILQKTQEELKDLLYRYLSKQNFEPISGDGYLYAKGDIPIMLVAHLDIVHKKIPEEIYFDEQQMVLWSPTGIGGDDRCGVYLITQIINHGFRPHILFLEDEEIGCVGAGKCTRALEKPDVKFMIEIDRRGKNDCVFYNCNNKEFIDYIQSFGFIKNWGTCSDIKTLSDAWDIASVNLSSGYYNEHTNYEYIKLKDLNVTYRRVIEILQDDTKEKPYYDYQKLTYKTSYWNGYKKKEEKGKENKYLCTHDGIAYYEHGYYDRFNIWHFYED